MQSETIQAIGEKMKTCLRRENELRQGYLEAQRHEDRLKAHLKEIEAGLTLKGRLLPFLQRKEKEWKASLKNDLEGAREAREIALREMDAYFPVVQEAARDWLEEENDPDYLNSLKVNGFFGTSQRRLEKFRETVETFLKAIGEARAAMSARYNLESGTYSSHALKLIEVAIRMGRRVDQAVEDIDQLNAEFATKTDGSIYSSISLPEFGRARYEKTVRRIAGEPIGPAQLAFEELLKECEQLHDEGIRKAYEVLRQAEGDHREVTDEYVTQRWQRWQQELLENGRQSEC